MNLPRLYGELADWWPLVSAPDDYAEEAAHFVSVLQEHHQGLPRTLLELGSGGGNNASHMKGSFESVTLVDLSPGMLEVSRSLNPECEHQVGDMRSIRLNRVFDAVFIHDALCYLTTLDELRSVADTVSTHLRHGGVCVLAPDFVKETFEPSTRHGGRDGEGRGLRYLEWTWDPDPADDTYVTDYAFALRDASGSVELEHDRHIEGLFTTADWLRVLAESQLSAHALSYRHSEVARDMVIFVGKKPVPGRP